MFLYLKGKNIKQKLANAFEEKKKKNSILNIYLMRNVEGRMIVLYSNSNKLQIKL